MLFYAAGSTTPTRVYGQPNFTSTSSGNGATGLNLPLAAAMDGSGGLYVVDALGYRVLFYPAGSTTATQVWGQASLTSYYAAPASAGTFYRPAGVVMDGNGGLYIADSGNNRTLFFPRTATLNGVTFTTGTNGCSGPTVGVYGSDTMAGYIQATAADYCSYQLGHGTPATGAIDVEYAGGGDSCSGVSFAAGSAPSAGADAIGVSDTFAGPCGVNPALIQDNVVSGNIVDLITECPGAALPQGGAAINNTIYPGTPCAGNGSGAAGSATMYAPNDLSVNVVYLLFQDNIANWSQVGATGCATCTPATGQVYTQNRTLGSGTRITECYNIYGQGGDNSCLENVPGGSEAGTSGTMEAPHVALQGAGGPVASCPITRRQ